VHSDHRLFAIYFKLLLLELFFKKKGLTLDMRTIRH